MSTSPIGVSVYKDPKAPDFTVKNCSRLSAESFLNNSEKHISAMNRFFCYSCTYISGYYNPSVRIINLVSHTQFLYSCTHVILSMSGSILLKFS